MADRHWQVFADLAAPGDSAALLRVVDAIPGSALAQFDDGTAEASMIIDAPTQREATLFVRLLMLDLDLTVTGLSITETAPDDGDDPFAPLDLDDPHAVRAAEWSQSLARSVPACA